ncbi:MULTISPECIES: phage tail assembly protein [Acinetobacter]|uniref:phage tail assembly protein n=1 Tax=Acinetobacter TaxID=469 RepID=UPI00188A2265|nr:phage tail assembly protein [Acinetobacter sp. SK-43]MBF4456789.1 phage tail assembly protein [Acinetobacter sp. SK-43]
MNTQDQDNIQTLTEVQLQNQEFIKNPNEEVVPLEEPITSGGQKITHITIRKPNVKALSGVSLQAIYQHDVNALIKVLPRVTTPALTPQQVLELDPVDFAQLGGHLVTFLYPKDLQKAIKEEQQ